MHPTKEGVTCKRDATNLPTMAGHGLPMSEGFALLDGGTLARTRVGNRAGVRPQFRDVAAPARELTGMGVCGFK